MVKRGCNDSLNATSAILCVYFEKGVSFSRIEGYNWT